MLPYILIKDSLYNTLYCIVAGEDESGDAAFCAAANEKHELLVVGVFDTVSTSVRRNGEILRIRFEASAMRG